ncbi:MAG TPA: protein kinase [Gemmataceae bacterium]|nr:protein kinase [Gemmataceae bacterium]
MRVTLTVTAGPHKGREFSFDRHDTFLVGRSKHAHFQLSAKDKFFSRIHFMIEVNPPQCRLIDMGSHNGTYVNGQKALSADLKNGDQIRAGHTMLRVNVTRGGAAVMPPTVDFDPAPATTEITLPRIPGYQLERELGRGTMGVTYLGRRTGDSTLFAIKVVKPSHQGSPVQIDEFLRAARFLTKIEHPNIVHLREVGGCPSGFYFVSDFVPGVNVSALLQRDGPLPVNRAVRWVNQVLLGLEYAHGKHFVHRDIKPANVIVAEIDGKEVVKLSDYGTAHVYQAAPFAGLSVTAALLDMAAFMPPELLFNYQEINPLADQYSVAAILYYLLTGTATLEVQTEERKRYSSLLRRVHVPIRERRGDVSPALADVIHKGLARTPGQRFANVASFRKAILRAVQGDGA